MKEAIRAIDDAIAQMAEIRDALESKLTEIERDSDLVIKITRKNKLSPAAREKIVTAQKRRWEKFRNRPSE